MRQYLKLLEEVLEKGEDREDRTGVGTRTLFGVTLRFDLGAGFPAVTTKRLAFRAVVEELLWFLSGSTDAGRLRERGVHIWDANARAWEDRAAFPGDLGRIYGAQWRSWRRPEGGTVDQIAEAVRLVREEPWSRRILVSAWNPGELERMALPPCHVLFQLHVHHGDRLSLLLFQRSGDLFLGVPFNIASYALLCAMIAQVTGKRPHELVHVIGEAHLYRSHFEQARIQLAREPLPPPRLELDPAVERLDDFRAEHIRLVGYRHHPPIPAPLAV